MLLLLFLLGIGCSATNLPVGTEDCKIRTYIDAELSTFLSARFQTQQLSRMAVFPFEVPETFAPAGNESLHFGRELARKFHAELLGRKLVPIVELFNRDRWPGKRAEFFTDNNGAIELARQAGYDLALVGYMEEIKDDRSIVVYTKVIDTESRITLWHAKSTVVSHAREVNKFFGAVGTLRDRPELFNFREKADEMARCTVGRMGAEE